MKPITSEQYMPIETAKTKRRGSEVDKFLNQIFTQRAIDKHNWLLKVANSDLEFAIEQRVMFNKVLNSRIANLWVLDAFKRMEKTIAEGSGHIVFKEGEIEIDHIAIFREAMDLGHNDPIFSQRVIDEHKRLLRIAEIELDLAIALRGAQNQRLNECVNGREVARAKKQIEKMNAAYTYIVFKEDEIEIDYIAIWRAAIDADWVAAKVP